MSGRQSKVAIYRVDTSDNSSNRFSPTPDFVPHFEENCAGDRWTSPDTRIGF